MDIGVGQGMRREFYDNRFRYDIDMAKQHNADDPDVISFAAPVHTSTGIHDEESRFGRDFLA